MITFPVLYETVIIDEACSESPWGTVGVFSPSIAEWLDGQGEWDYDYNSECVHIIFITVENEQIAMLFKLTWV